MFQQAFRSILESGDAVALQRAWCRLFPHLDQPRNESEARVMLHRARTEAKSVSLARRLYSHAWLTERGLPSALPYELRPKGERDRPMIVSAVGVSVRPGRPERAELARAVERVMADAAAESYAEGVTSPEKVSARMWEARSRFLEAA